MIETITKNNLTFATIIRSSYRADDIKFFTPSDFPQQLGYMNRKKGYIINAHKHAETTALINKYFETLVVRSGKVKVSIYDEYDNYFTETIILTGDIILLSNCGHGFEMLEDSEMIEIKQGPFFGEGQTIAIDAYSVVGTNRK